METPNTPDNQATILQMKRSTTGQFLPGTSGNQGNKKYGAPEYRRINDCIIRLIALKIDEFKALTPKTPAEMIAKNLVTRAMQPKADKSLIDRVAGRAWSQSDTFDLEKLTAIEEQLKQLTQAGSRKQG